MIKPKRTRQSKKERKKEMEISIRPELKELFPPLTESERSALKKSILNEGLRDNLIVGTIEGKSFIIGGHHRYCICQKHGINIPENKITKKEFHNIDEAREWLINSQLGRRNLSPSQRCELALKASRARR